MKQETLKPTATAYVRVSIHFKLIFINKNSYQITFELQVAGQIGLLHIGWKIMINLIIANKLT
jgi:hypothetical protein